ncbi:hypothetical protein [Branchiibius cervicis]|uniref:Uncharacterized protein n=1 Tax=Branchiibius cervicis TaxID=908252 RepID=A0ABW2AQV1_9MICO
MTWWPRLAVLDRTRIVAYLSAAAAALAFIGCATAAGHVVFWGALLVMLGWLGALVDGSAAGLVLFTGALVLDWIVSDTPPTTWWALPAAALLALIWSVCVLAGAGPHAAALPPGLVRVWLIRTAWLAAGCCLLGALVLAATGRISVGSPGLAALALLAIAGAAVWFSVRGAD